MAVLLVPFAEAYADAPLSTLKILTKAGAVHFQVELADTPQLRAKGLMYRKTLPAKQGMLFDFEREHDILMWMKNTYIPLDMVFINADGHVVSIVKNTKPLTLDIIESGVNACAVLEVNAGSADRHSIQVGNRVYHPLFVAKKKRKSGWK